MHLTLTVRATHRQVRCVRDEDSATYRSCAFAGNFAALALGTHSGELRLHDTFSGDLIDSIDAHASPVYQLKVRCRLARAVAPRSLSLSAGQPTQLLVAM